VCCKGNGTAENGGTEAPVAMGTRGARRRVVARSEVDQEKEPEPRRPERRTKGLSLREALLVVFDGIYKGQLVGVC
jgi:hypothetical protein